MPLFQNELASEIPVELIYGNLLENRVCSVG